MAPVNRDGDEERLARIDQMLEDLRLEGSRLKTDNQAVRRDAIVTRQDAAHARRELHRVVTESRLSRHNRAAKKR